MTNNMTPARNPKIRELVYNDESALAFEQLAEEEPVLLITPILKPPLPIKPSPDGRPRDPFEPLGEAMKDIHNNIVQIHYEPQTGLTTEHARFMDEIAAVLLIVCEPAAKAIQDRDGGVEKQLAFAQNAVHAYHKIHEGTEPPAFAMAYCGSGTFTPPSDVSLCVRGPGYMDADWPGLAFAVLRAFTAGPQPA